MWLLVEQALIVAVITLTISRSKLFRPLRRTLRARVPVLGTLASCPYCLSHWIGWGVAVVFQPQGAFWMGFVLVALAAPVMAGVMQCIILIGKADDDDEE